MLRPREPAHDVTKQRRRLAPNTMNVQTAAAVGPMEIDDPSLAKYKDQIEKDLANLE